MTIHLQTKEMAFILCNTYNVPNSNKTIRKLKTFFSLQNIVNMPILLMGDFNKHHVLWPGPHVPERCTISDSEEFIQLLGKTGLELSLPLGTPTFTLVAHKIMLTINLTFAIRETLAPSIIKCDTVLGESSCYKKLLPWTWIQSQQQTTLTKQWTA
ncbi:hypothetical protein EDD18DRAFT_1100877 [Armillaria luteobubalina]|uniref:Endonuclease/exonuclease/phosphatase domain-containing protein n=1 Tax=Armillaria luteobubalina TaxID=153913 RepID=A0AA39QGE6_9AGAR|nr:hypothetical protein EDD18DRAFT_1100877 [Armillaria luteobubalina]